MQEKPSPGTALAIYTTLQDVRAKYGEESEKPEVNFTGPGFILLAYGCLAVTLALMSLASARLDVQLSVPVLIALTSAGVYRYWASYNGNINAHFGHLVRARLREVYRHIVDVEAPLPNLLPASNYAPETWYNIRTKTADIHRLDADIAGEIGCLSDERVRNSMKTPTTIGAYEFMMVYVTGGSMRHWYIDRDYKMEELNVLLKQQRIALA